MRGMPVGAAGQHRSAAAAAPVIVRPYLAPEIPPVRLSNTARIRGMVRAGLLYLTVQDAIALALENNIDIEVARYNPLIAAWNLERAGPAAHCPEFPAARRRPVRWRTDKAWRGARRPRA